jgi:L-alanine-DL-glutamate epimerase-like enolase superfamily enzyme
LGSFREGKRSTYLPIYQLLGYEKAERKLPCASVLFGNIPEETLEKAESMRKLGFSAVKFGWGPYGRGTVEADEVQVFAVREGVGDDAHLMIDAGTIFNEDVEAAAHRLPALASAEVKWFEEPVAAAATSLYQRLSHINPAVPLAGGEGAHNAMYAEPLIEQGAVGFIQIDTGYIGGISAAHRVAKFAHSRGVQSVPESPGLGIEFSTDAIKKYLLEMEITVKKKILYRTSSV